MKTWPHYSLNQLSKTFLKLSLRGIVFGTIVLVTIPSFSFAQQTPLKVPDNTALPGSFSTLSKLIEFDKVRMKVKRDLLVGRKIKSQDIPASAKVDLDPDFLNSLLLNSRSSYLRLAGQGKCNFYYSIMNRLLEDDRGVVADEFPVQFKNDAGTDVSGLMARDLFTERVIFKECPESRKLVALFQVKTLDKAIQETKFEAPTTQVQCQMIYDRWLEDPKTPFWCQIRNIIAGPASQDPKDKNTALAKILKAKLGEERVDQIVNFCSNGDSPQHFCYSSFSSSFFSRIVEGSVPDIYIKDVCQQQARKTNWSPMVLRECVATLRADSKACHWGDIEHSGLAPRPGCDQLSLALNHSPLRADYHDCPRYSDSTATTNMARILLNLGKLPIQPTSGICSAISAGTVLEFNRGFDNETMWTAGLCYLDKIEQKEKCLPAFYGDYGNSASSMTRVMGEVLSRTKGADAGTVCKMVSNSDWNPALLDYKYGCFLVYDRDNCGFGNCSSKVFYNETEVKGLNLKGQLTFDYFPTTLNGEKFSQAYILSRDAQKKTRSIQSLMTLQDFFRQNPAGLIHGIGCAEDLLPGFFKKMSLNQCTPLPFIIDGLIKEEQRITLVMRSAADSVHAPRLVSWPTVFAAVKTYQVHQPLKQWSMHAVF